MATFRDENGLTAKQRAFALLVVAGKSQAEAYKAAYGNNSSRATCGAEGSRTASKPAVRAFIQRLREGVDKTVAAEVTSQLKLDRTYVLENLREVVERCMERRPIKDSKGQPVTIELKDGTVAAAYTFDSKGANQALALIGKELGMFIERKEVRHGPLAQASDEELDRELTQLAQEMANLTGKPLKQILLESVRTELAIDITPSVKSIEHAADQAEPDPTDPGGVLERAADGTL